MNVIEGRGHISGSIFVNTESPLKVLYNYGYVQSAFGLLNLINHFGFHARYLPQSYQPHL